MLILYVALSAWLIISPAIYLYWHFHRGIRPQHEEHFRAVFLGTLITLTAVIGAGLAKSLTHASILLGIADQNGTLVGLLSCIGFSLGLFVAIYLMESVSRRETIEDKKTGFCHEPEVHRLVDDLDCMNLLKPSIRELEWSDDMIGSPVRGRSMVTN